MSVTSSLLQKIAAVTVPVPDLDAGLRFYRDSLGHELRWRNDRVGQAGLRLPGSDTELVLTRGRRTSRGRFPESKNPAIVRRPNSLFCYRHKFCQLHGNREPKVTWHRQARCLMRLSLPSTAPRTR
jgi:catechol 2,3-dioxygenase-like lactoylglutathione lyase family enzyme